MIVQPAKLRSGAGSGKPEDGLCLMQMVDWFAGRENVSDHPACACPTLSRVGIRLNDMAPDQAARDSLWPLVWRLLGSRDYTAMRARTEHIVREVTHRIVAPLFDKQWPEHAAALRRAGSMSTILEAEAAAWAVAQAAPFPRAACPAAWAAESARAAWAAESARAVAWETLRDIFVEAIELGPHGEEDPVAFSPRAEALRELLKA